MISSFFIAFPFYFQKFLLSLNQEETFLVDPADIQPFFKLDCRFLKGASSIDKHFQSTPFEKNIPVSCISCVIIQFSCLFTMSINTRDS